VSNGISVFIMRPSRNLRYLARGEQLQSTLSPIPATLTGYTLLRAVLDTHLRARPARGASPHAPGVPSGEFRANRVGLPSHGVAVGMLCCSTGLSAILAASMD
jgi:hypothetical protein